MSKDDTKQAIIGLTEFMKGITGNQKLKIPEVIAKEYGIEQDVASDNLENCTEEIAKLTRMTVDEAIIQSRIQLTLWEEGCESKLDNSPKAVEMLIEITRRYQKIEQIMDELNGNFYGSYLKDRQTLEKIYEVVEDGNDE